MEPGKSGLVKSMVSMNAGLEDPRNSQKTAFQHSFYIGTRFHKMSHVTSFRSAWNVATENEGTRRTRAFEVVVSALPITDSSFFQRFGAPEGSTHRIDPNPSLPPADSGARQSDRHPQGCRHNQGLSMAGNLRLNIETLKPWFLQGKMRSSGLPAQVPIIQFYEIDEVQLESSDHVYELFLSEFLVDQASSIQPSSIPSTPSICYSRTHHSWKASLDIPGRDQSSLVAPSSRHYHSTIWILKK